MEHLTNNVIQLLQYLLPGFLSAWVFYGFTSYVKPSQFERVVQALIFTLVIQMLVYPTKQILGSEAGPWNSELELIVSSSFAIAFGFLFASFANNDYFHKFVRWLKISKESSHPSGWHSAFSNNATYIVLHLNDGRRLYGWPKEWPTSSDSGHFLMMQPSWLHDDSEKPVDGVDFVLISVKDVRMVEFISKTWEDH